MNINTICNLETEEAILAQLALQKLKKNECDVSSGYFNETRDTEKALSDYPIAVVCATTTQLSRQGVDTDINSTLWGKLHNSIILRYHLKDKSKGTDNQPLPETLNSYAKELQDNIENESIEPNYRICAPPMIKRKIGVKIKCIGRIQPNLRFDPEWL